MNIIKRKIGKLKIILTMTMLLLISLHSISQADQHSKRNIQFGIKAAIAFVGLTGSKNYTSYPSGNIYSLGDQFHWDGFGAGIVADIRLTEKFSFLSELDYSLKGNKYYIDGVLNGKSYSISLDVNLNYLSIPLFLKYQPRKISGFYIYAGPEFGLLLSAKQVVAGNMDAGKTDLYQKFRHTDFGLGIGVGYYFFRSFSVDIRYIYGIKNIAPTNENTYVHNRSLQAGLAYRL